MERPQCRLACVVRGHEVRGTDGRRMHTVHQAALGAVDIEGVVVALIEGQVPADQALELDADLALDDVLLGIEEVGVWGAVPVKSNRIESPSTVVVHGMRNRSSFHSVQLVER